MARENMPIKISLSVIFFTIIFLSEYTVAQYAPIELGNVWLYQSSDGSKGRVEIIDTLVIIDSITYSGYAFAYQSYVSGFVRLREDSFYVSKEDSTFPEPLNEFRYYKRNAQLGDTWVANFGTYTIIDTFLANVFDSSVTVKILNENFGLVEWDYVWTEQFGKLSKMDWLGEVQYYLQGCVINGEVFGDTTFIVSVVNDFRSNINYELANNYPNPFNSNTVISFTIPEGDNVLLVVYNILGEKMKVLVNKFLSSGKCTIQFNADEFVSGTYFYVLKTSNFTQAKKMLLIK